MIHRLLAAIALTAGVAGAVSASPAFEVDAKPANAVVIAAHGIDWVAIDARVGIGRAEIRAPHDGFPREVTLRFPGFRHLERVRAASGGRSITCDLQRYEGGSTEHRCRTVGTGFDGALVRGDRGFELVLPAGFAAESLSIEWVDQFR